jgi:sec-independent protein translocase protein TatC
MTLPRDQLPPAGPPEALPQMSLLEHLDELRRRIVYSLVGLTVGFLACWVFVDEIFRFLAAPIQRLLPEGTKLAFLGVTDPFVLYIKVALLAGVFAASPFLLYQAWLFIAPGLYARERRGALPFVVFGTLFFVAGGSFAYYVAFPFAVEFLLGVGVDFQPVITIELYFSFLRTVILGLGLMFELPIVIVRLAQFGLVTPRFLIRHFRWAIVLIFVVAAVITPTPDVFNLCVFAVPTIGLYLLGVGAAAVVTRRRKAAAEVREAESAG